MGTVFLVEDDAGRIKAAKVLDRSLADEKSAHIIDRFKQEFSILKDLSHPCINKVYDFGFDKASGCYYFTSEFVDGPKFLSAAENETVRAVEDMFVQTLRALEYLHSHGIIHCDIKSSNVLVKYKDDGSYQMQIIDFGLAALGSPKLIVGTPSYMAPEVILKNRPDSRADLYSLGVLLYSALAKFNPFSADEPGETFQRQLNLTPDPPSTYNQNIKPYLDEIILTLLNKKPSDRFSTAAHVIRAINIGGAKSYPVETEETFLGYLPAEGKFIGRKEMISEIKNQVSAIKKGDASVPFILSIGGERGTGKKRILSELKYHAQLNEMDVIGLESTDMESIEAFNRQISGLMRHIERPTIVSCPILGVIATKKMATETVNLIGRLASRIKSGRALSNIRTAPKIMLAIAGSDEEIPLFRHLLSIGEADLRHHHLKNFNKDEVKEYLSVLTGIGDLPETLVGETLKLTGGNPLFISEIIKELIREGVLYDKEGRWNKETIEDIGIHFEKLKVPKKLSALLDGLYENASENEKAIMEAMAAWNRPATIREIAPASGAKDIISGINSLIRTGNISLDANYITYHFRNPLLKETIYGKMPFGRKCQLHGRIAKFLEGSKPPNPAELLWHRGHGEDARSSVDALMELAILHTGKSEGYYATAVLDEAQNRAADIGYRTKEILIETGRALVLTRKYDDAIDAYKKAIEMIKTDTASAHEEKIMLYERLALVYIRNEQLNKAKHLLDGAGKHLPLPDKGSPISMNLENLMARIAFLEGRIEDAIAMYKGTKDLWKNFPEDLKKEVLGNDLAHAYLQKGELDLAEAEFKKDIEFYADIGTESELERSYYSLGQLKRIQKKSGEAAEYFEKAIKIAKKLGDSEILLRAYNDLGNLYQQGGKRDEGMYWYERALDLAARTTDDSTASAIAVNIGLIESNEGALDKAKRYFESAINIYNQARRKTPLDLNYLTRAHLELADIFRQKKEFAKAQFHIKSAAGMAAGAEGLQDIAFWIEKTRAEIARDQGEAKSAERATSRLEGMADTGDKKTALRAFLKSLGGGSEETTVEGIIFKGEKKFSIFDIHTTIKSEVDMAEKHYRYILEINKYLSGEEDISFILKTILKYAIELSKAESGLVLLSDKSGGLKIMSSANLEVDDKLSEISVNIAKNAIGRNEVVVTSDATVDERFKTAESVILLGLKSILCVPIHSAKATIGVIYLENRSRPGAFGDADKDVLAAFADQAGIAIQNTSTCQRLAASKEKLEKELSDTSVQLEKMSEELKKHKDYLKKEYRFDRMVTASPKMERVFEILRKVSNTYLSVLLIGESGTGKEIIARAIHYNSDRAKGPFIAVNCGSIPATLIESELFGYRAGAFTGATKDKMGLFEAANAGTIFLDEISELDLALQSKLLRVIQEREITRIGDTKPRKCDVRIISASNKDIEKMAKENKFREDLFYRLSEIKVGVPPLRERGEDIPLLISEFIDEYCEQHKVTRAPKAEKSFIKACLGYNWPGNIRELENTVRVATALADGGRITTMSLPDNHALKSGATKDKASLTPTDSGSMSEPIDDANRYDPAKTWDEYEALIIASAYRTNGFDVKKTGSSLDIAVTTVYKKISELGLKDRSNPLFSAPFNYKAGTSLKAYRNLIFKAAWKHAGEHPYQAIKALSVSQGYFYKVMKEF